MSKSIKEKREDRRPHQWQPAAEEAPSVMKADEPSTARVFGMIGASLVLFGAMTLVLRDVFGLKVHIDTGLLNMVIALGVVGLLSHAVFDPDLQVRRCYLAFGFLTIVVGGVLICLKLEGTALGGLGWGSLSLIGGLLFVQASLRHESDETIRGAVLNILGGAGLLMTTVALIFGKNFTGQFLIPHGLVLAFLGLAFLIAAVGKLGVSSEAGFRLGLTIGGFGAWALLFGVGRSVIASFGKTPYFAPYGMMYIAIGVVFLGVCLGICSDNRVVVMVRRELAGFFYSPIAYMVLIGVIGISFMHYSSFLERVSDKEMVAAAPVFEPIIRDFIFSFWPVVCVVFIVPVLTMRLMSEEWRTGTMEVTLTAPVTETSVVLSKFLACLIQFLLLWLPWVFYLVAMRVGGGQAFDYRGILTFFVALLFTGAGFVAMGLFFSSLTRNQITSAVLTFTGMLVLTFPHFLHPMVSAQSAWKNVLYHVSYVDLWNQSFDGFLIPRYLVFHASAAVFWLFLSVKVLESRKWS